MMVGRKLTAARAREIAERIASGDQHTVIAEEFAVSVETVGAIKSGKRWASAIDDDLRARMAAARTSTALNPDSARSVMLALEAGRSGQSVAKEFRISPSMVSAIKHGRAWADLDPDLPARLAAKESSGKALTAAQVGELKRRLREGLTTRQIAQEFDVSSSTVSAISSGKTWAHVD